RLYQQFAVTIAISVLLSAFNALTLSPALSALLLRPRVRRAEEKLGTAAASGSASSRWWLRPLEQFFERFNRGYNRLTAGYVGLSRVLIHKSAFSLLFLGLVAVAAGIFGKKLPTGFLPEEDQGFLYIGVQLPFAASLERTVAVCKQVEDLALATPGVQACTTVTGFNLLSFSRNAYSATMWVSLKEWGERTKKEESYTAIKANLTRKVSQIPGAVAFVFPPPSIQGVGTAGGFTFILEDRAGKDIP